MTYLRSAWYPHSSARILCPFLAAIPKKNYFNLCVCVCARMHVCLCNMCAAVQGGQRRKSDLLELGLQAVPSHLT